MRSQRVIHMVGCHAEGEVGNVIVGGVAPPAGDTIWEQGRYLLRDGALRDLVLNEPRGGVYGHVNLLVPPKSPEADMGFIIMEPEDNPPMSGSNSICVATVLLETGILPMMEPETLLKLEAPGGVVEVRAACRDGKVESITTRNVASFVDRMDAALEVEGLGTLTVDTAFGGDSFVFVDAKVMGFAIAPDEARELAETGMKIANAAHEQMPLTHPENPEFKQISFCQFAAPIVERDGVKTGRNAVVIKPGKLDRSPCGTGCSARMALMHARGALKQGERFIGISPIDSEFHCRVEEEAEIGGKPAIIPSLRGRAWLTGTSQIMLDADDPWPRGYRLSDTWPNIG